jgi:hypothetical protein
MAFCSQGTLQLILTNVHDAVLSEKQLVNERQRGLFRCSANRRTESRTSGTRHIRNTGDSEFSYFLSAGHRALHAVTFVS